MKNHANHGLLIMLIILTPLTLYADTQVSGSVEGEWTVNRSPYIATDEIYVGRNDVLTIEAGVEVLFEDFYAFRIFGRLQANGSEEDSIIFRPEEENQEWRGLRFINADRRSRLSYCVITHGNARSDRAYQDTLNSGGNVFIWQSNIEISNSRISNGQAIGYGAGIGIWRSDPYISDCIINGNASQTQGGGLFLSRSSPDIHQCLIIDNQAGWGGGGACLETDSDARIEDCVFKENRAQTGGGIVDYGGSPLISHCYFEGNFASVLGGGAYLRGDGNDPIVEWCTFYRNAANVGTGNGGGILLRFNTGSEVRFCRLIENQAHLGGGIYVQQETNQSPQCYVHHNMFLKNNAQVAGGAVAVSENMGNSPLEIENCTFMSNTSNLIEEPGTAFAPRNSFISFFSSIIWGDHRLFWDSNRITVSYSNIIGGYNGEGNSDENPLLFAFDSTWCLLQGNSPCLDSGDPNLPDDPDDTRNDRGWMYYPQNAIDGLNVDAMSVELATGERCSVNLHFRNETGVPICVTPMDKWQSGDPDIVINVSGITGDNEITSAAWVSGEYLVVGGNNGDSPNIIYRLSREYRLTDQFDQPGNRVGEPIWDLAGDGNEILYGSSGEDIIEFYSDGGLGEIYAGPGGFRICQGLGADFNNSDNPPDIYIGGEEGLISMSDNEIRERQRFEAGDPVLAIAVKGNMRGIYTITEPYPSYFLLSLMMTDDSLIVPLYRLTPPGDDYRVGGIEITHEIQPEHATLVGIWKSDDHSDRLYILDLYTVWLAIQPNPKLLMPGEEADWEIVFAGDQTPAGEYETEFYFTVNGCGVGGEIQARLELTNASARNESPDLPSVIMLSPAYPNPFNSASTIRYSLPISANVSLAVYDPLGKWAGSLFEGYRQSGIHTVTLTATDLPSGLYFVRLTTSGQTFTQKALLIR